ncbi:MAG: GDP-mannose 4,6-dehydratase [Armatimonadetes bacterium]|nr:GDP-mannose 4,6-dehydratase [Armatimonadota bacterium]
MRVLVTGAAGFAGGHLCELLLLRGDRVAGVTRGAPGGSSGVHWLSADLADAAATARAVAEAQPEVIYHLAGAAATHTAAQDPVGTLRDNVLATASILQAALDASPRPRVLLVTSSEVYGHPATARPLTEETPTAPGNLYGLSKVAAHELGRHYGSLGLEVVEARPFNHCGPRQRLGFVVPDFAAQVAAVARGEREPVVRVGDLSPARDFTDVRDIVRGYADLALGGVPGEIYHLCRGEAVSIGDILDRLLAIAGVAARVETDCERLRPGPATLLRGSAEKARWAVGWEAGIPLEETLRAVYAEWAAVSAQG